MKKIYEKMLAMVLDVAGCGMVTVGVYLLHVPAGFMVGGLSCLALSWAHNRKEGDGE